MARSQDSFGAFEAKTHLSDLLDRVEKGKRIVITRHGRAVAQLIPMRDTSFHDLPEMAASAWEATAGTRLPSGKTLKDLIETGRKR